jgi:hypothetical protein
MFTYIGKQPFSEGVHMSTAVSPARSTDRRVPLYMHIAAWAAPALIATGFAMIALVPVLVVLIGSCTDPRVRFLRWWTTALAGAYAIPLTILNVRDDPAPSLTKDMHPAFLVLILVVAAAVLVRIYVVRRTR